MVVIPCRFESDPGHHFSLKVGLFEEWETKAYQEAYMAWRMGNGDHDNLVEPHLEGFGITYADVKHTY